MIYKEAMEEIVQIRNKHIRDYEKKINKIYKDIPRIEEIDNEISDISTTTATKLLFSEELDLAEKAKAKIGVLRKEKEEIIKGKGIPLDFLEMDYSCRLCNDKGFLEDGSRCTCLEDIVKRKQYERSGLREILAKENFDTFNIKIFSDEPFAGEIRSPRENMKEIRKISQKFSKNLESSKSLFFYGKTGLGKTFLSSCIVKDAIDRGYSVVYESIFRIIEIAESASFNKPHRGDVYYEDLFDADLLVIDDLGSEVVNSFTNAELFNIINSRIMADKRMLISSNLEPEKLTSIYSERIFSRIISEFILLKFYGSDQRRSI